MTRKGILVVAVLFLIAFVLLELGRRGYEKIKALPAYEKTPARTQDPLPAH
jgi:hypothetical protein